MNAQHLFHNRRMLLVAVVLLSTALVFGCADGISNPVAPDIDAPAITDAAGKKGRGGGNVCGAGSATVAVDLDASLSAAYNQLKVFKDDCRALKIGTDDSQTADGILSITYDSDYCWFDDPGAPNMDIRQKMMDALDGQFTDALMWMNFDPGADGQSSDGHHLELNLPTMILDDEEFPVRWFGFDSREAPTAKWNDREDDDHSVRTYTYWGTFGMRVDVPKGKGKPEAITLFCDTSKTGDYVKVTVRAQ